jgi:hypothetical protein
MYFFGFWYIFYPGIAGKFRNVKRKGKKDLVSLAEYFDLVWCLYNDLWRTLIFLDDTYDVHFFTQVIGIWRV